MLQFDENGHLVPHRAMSQNPEQNPLIAEISATLESLERANRMLAFHRSFDEPDENALENFERLRADFLRQLAELLRNFEVEAKFSYAVAA